MLISIERAIEYDLDKFVKCWHIKMIAVAIISPEKPIIPYYANI